MKLEPSFGPNRGSRVQSAIDEFELAAGGGGLFFVIQFDELFLFLGTDVRLQSGHPLNQLYLLSSLIHCSAFSIQNQRRWLGQLALVLLVTVKCNCPD